MQLWLESCFCCKLTEISIKGNTFAEYHNNLLYKKAYFCSIFDPTSDRVVPFFNCVIGQKKHQKVTPSPPTHYFPLSVAECYAL